MISTINNIKTAGIGFGIFALSCVPLMSQEKPFTVKVGVAYNIVQTDEISKNCLGIETVLEKKLKEKLFTEWEIGLYTRNTNTSIYSRMQTNIGLEYKPIMKNGWAMGGKAAIGVSSEFHKGVEETLYGFNITSSSKRISLNKLVELNVEKVFKNGAGVNFGVSREIDRNIWKVGAKVILKPRG